MDKKPKWDFTPEHWFSTGINRSQRHRNILLDVVPNFDYLATYGRNTLNNITHYIGANNIMDKITGYVHNWDGRYCCDRCGAIKELDGSAKNIRMAYALKEMPWMKRVGLCLNCEAELYHKDEGIISDTNSVFWKDKSSMPNDWAEYAWL